MIWGLAGFLVGAVLGSFVKALADRSLGFKSFWGRSYCPKCQQKLAWYDLLPIFSFILLKGKCRYCRKRIGIEYLVVEMGMGILIAFLFWQTFKSFQFSVFSFQSIFNFQFSIFIFDLFFKIFFVTVLGILFLTDLKKMFIPDRIILPAILIGAISLFVLTLYKIVYLYFYLSQTAVGQKLLPPYSDYFQRHALAVAEPFFVAIITAILIGAFFMGLIILTKGKGMGGGDVKLGAFIGIMLGFPGAGVALVLSFVIGAVFGLSLIVTGKKHFGQSIPFGPFLVLGSLITLYWGNQILDWYIRLGSK